MTTLLNRSKTGLIARDGSKHLQIDKRGRCDTKKMNQREMKHWIWNCGVVSLEGFQNEQKAWIEIYLGLIVEKVCEVYLFHR